VSDSKRLSSRVCSLLDPYHCLEGTFYLRRQSRRVELVMRIRPCSSFPVVLTSFSVPFKDICLEFVHHTSPLSQFSGINGKVASPVLCRG
jgi:hypothetical protein